MPKRPTRTRDVNQVAASIVAEATGTTSPDAEASVAAQNGRLGGLKGGRARAAKLTATERSEIAKKAAQARWASRSN